MAIRILLVDDEELFRTSAAQVLERRLRGASVVTAADGTLATERLAEKTFDVVITDLRMPNMDGFELLSWMVSRGVPTPVIVTTSLASEQAQDKAKLRGALAVLNKPVDFDRLISLVHRLVGERPQASTITGLTLPGFAQLLSMEQRTCRLEVRSAGRSGVLHFLKGELIEADDGKSTGELAALKIIAWEQPQLKMQVTNIPVARTIQRSLNFLLLESSRMLDEGNLFEAPAPSQQPTSHAGESFMPNIKETLEDLMKLDGAIAVALADWDSGLTLGTAGGGSHFDIELAAAGNCNVVKAKMAVMQSLGIRGAIQDILITLEDQNHLLRPMKRYANMFLYVAIDKSKGNMGLARAKLLAAEAALTM